MKNKKILLGVLLCAVVVTVVYRHCGASAIAAMGLQPIANGDAQFWLMQGAPNYRLMACSVHYQFDTRLNEGLVRERLGNLVAPYAMFRRNVVEVDRLPYWQSAGPDWNTNFRVLDADEDKEVVRKNAELAVSKAAMLGQSLPLFRVYLASDRRQLVFVWHHVISDLEGMFNKHAKHLFKQQVERTQFGYQRENRDMADAKERLPALKASLLDTLKNTERPPGLLASVMR